MKDFAELASILAAILSTIISFTVLWNVTRGIFTLLATIQRKLNILRSLFVSLRGEFRGMQKFLKIHNGYHIREDIKDIEEDLLKQYDSGDTGF